VITRSLGPEAEIEVDLEGPLAVELGDVYLLCSDGLSGPVDDHEIGAFAGNFHPRDACRYLISLANLRGGLDNITVLIVRLGAWVDPDSTETLQQPDERPRYDGRPRGGWRARLAELVQGRRRSRAATAAEEHPYRTAECPINDDLLVRLHELTRAAQEQAIEEAWSLDWTALAGLRRQVADARDAKNAWVSLRKLGEILYLLGQAARFHRKSVGSSEVH
jgi:hypothetical protein